MEDEVANSEKHLWEYVRRAAEHGTATREGDHRRANKAYRELVKVFRELLESGSRRRLLTLLEHQDQAVRCWAATHTLRIDESRAIAALERLAAEKGLFAFDAEVVLSEWRKGTLVVEGDC